MRERSSGSSYGRVDRTSMQSFRVMRKLSVVSIEGTRYRSIALTVAGRIRGSC